MLRWRKWMRRRPVSDKSEPEGGLARVQQEYAGAWAAFKGGKVVEARRTPYELVAALHERDITDTTIVRIPGEQEPELIGLG